MSWECPRCMVTFEDPPEDQEDFGAILPCPFCGSRAELVQVADQNGAVVGCTGCHASGPLRIHAKDDANPHAIYSWNRRTNKAKERL